MVILPPVRAKVSVSWWYHALGTGLFPTTTNSRTLTLPVLGQVQIVCGLPDLVHLEHGDFLCDVIDFCDENNLVKTFKIEDFFSSEEYYFHSEDQARIVQLI